MVKEVSSAAEFDSELNTAGSKLVVVDFHATCKYDVPLIAHTLSRIALLAILTVGPFCNFRSCAGRQGVDHAKRSHPSSSGLHRR